LIAIILPAEGLAGQHSLCLQSAPEFLLTMPSGSAGSNRSTLPQLGLRAEIDSRFALFDSFFTDLSFGSIITSPSAYSDIGQRYRGYSSVFGSAAFGATLPIFDHRASIETGASLHVASWTGTQLAFAFIEIRNVIRLQDVNVKPFFADLFRHLSDQGTVRAEVYIPLSLQFRSDSASVSIGVGIGLRRDSYFARPIEASDEK